MGAPSLCAYPGGCRDLAREGSSMCRKHVAEMRRLSDRARPNATKRGYDARWRATRAAYLKAHPICQCDDLWCEEPATDVHHRDGVGPLGPRGHDPTNLQALAHDCHSRVTAQLQPGGFRKP